MSSLNRKSLLALLLVSLAFRLLFVARDMPDLVTHGPLYDDSFYSFGIARNIASGFGSTFDRLEPTNGYQPLYVMLLVPVYWVCGDNASAPIYVALVLSAVLNVLTGLILYRLLRRYASGWAALLGIVLWTFGPAIVRQALNGLETSLAMYLLAATLEYYITVYRRHRDPGPRQAVTLGLLLGLSVFARIDAALFGLALVADALWRGRDRRSLRRIALATAAAGVVMLPWCASSQLLVGSVLPESGEATRFLSEAYAPHDYPALARVSFEHGPPHEFLAYNLSRSMLLLGTSPVLHIYTRALERGMQLLHAGRGTTLYAVASLLALLLLAGVFVMHRWRLLHRHSDFNFLYLYAVLLVAAYSFVVFGYIFYSRYYYPIFFFSILLGAFAFDILLDLVPAARRRLVAVAIVSLYAVALPYMSWHRLSNGDYQFVHVVGWIAAHTEREATIGIFNCGAIGYFSDRRVVNLDGKVNPHALAALRAGRLRAYVAQRGIDYVIDHEWILNRFLLGDTYRDSGIELQRIDGDAALGVPGWAAYRVVQTAARATPSSTLVSRLHP